MLHGIKKFLDLRHGYLVCQAYKFCVDALEHSLHIHTHDVISSPPPSMKRETVRPPWSNICIHMTNCHYVSSHQNDVFWLGDSMKVGNTFCPNLVMKNWFFTHVLDRSPRNAYFPCEFWLVVKKQIVEYYVGFLMIFF